MSLTNQINIYAVDSDAFYTEEERDISILLLILLSDTTSKQPANKKEEPERRNTDWGTVPVRRHSREEIGNEIP